MSDSSHDVTDSKSNAIGVDRSYENAVDIIDSRRRVLRPKTKTSPVNPTNQVPKPKDKSDFRGTPSIAGMTEWLQMLGHTGRDLDNLKVIHVAGTKGKGSTCAFADSILKSHGMRTGYPQKIGLYTSPHLIYPEERICINSKPLDRSLFAKYFFEVYDKLPQLAEMYDPTKSVVERGPRFAQLFAVFAFHVFIREKVDATIIETHSGGEYDPTNIVPHPVVTAITSLGMDHVEMLGPTIENIAWHKSGIYKSGSAALSSVQDPAPESVLIKRAKDQGEVAQFVDMDPRLPVDAVQLKPDVQRKNASLAAMAVQVFLERTASTLDQKQLTVEDIHSGVNQFSWPGRFQTIRDNRFTWFLDAAHNDMSISLAAEWYVERSHAMRDTDVRQTRILIFSHIHESRDSEALLERLATTLKQSEARIDHVIFTTYDESEDRKGFKQLDDQETFRRVWQRVIPDTAVSEKSTIKEAMEYAQSLGKSDAQSHILMTGSQYLIGPALRVLHSQGVKT